MVAELLRLRLRILAGGFRRPPLEVLGLVLALIAAVAGVVLLCAGAVWVRQFETFFVIRAVVVVGSWLMAAALLVPMMVVRRPVLSARAFLGYPLSPLAVGTAIVAFAAIGPGLLLIPLALAPVAAWPDPASAGFAWAAAPLLFLQGLLFVQFGRHLGMALRRRPGLAAWADVTSAIVLLLGGALSLVVVAGRVPELLWIVKLAAPLNGVINRIPELLAATPLGMLWAAPGAASAYVADHAAAGQALGLSALLVVALLVLWVAVIGAQLRPTRRLPRPHRARVPGWFAHVPSTPGGAVAARAVTYWLRDPRYRSVFVLLPIVPALTLLALWVGGVPFPIAVLVPLPLMTALLAWSTVHNDIAYDSTAIWQHVAAQTRGVDDRRGRAVPVLLWGVVLLAVGVPLTAWGHGDPAVVPPLVGVCLALLLGGIGVGNLYSARFPYAAPRPGDPAWRAPQATGSQGGVAQAMSLLFVLLAAAPALAAGGAWWAAGEPWGWIALGAGVVTGLVVFAVGVTGGGAVFDRRGPELLAFTLRN